MVEGLHAFTVLIPTHCFLLGSRRHTLQPHMDKTLGTAKGNTLEVISAD